MINLSVTKKGTAEVNASNVLQSQGPNTSHEELLAKTNETEPECKSSLHISDQFVNTWGVEHVTQRTKSKMWEIP